MSEQDGMYGEEEGEGREDAQDNEDNIWADEDIEASKEEDDWTNDDQFFAGSDDPFTWEDNEGNLHEIQTGEVFDEMELRQTFETAEEAADYIEEILTSADQYFEIYEDEEGYHVYYMGGSE